MTAMDQHNWDAIERFILSTATDTVTVESMTRLPWRPRTEPLTRYGWILVIN